MIIMSSWVTLADKTPEVGQVCEWAVIHDDWSDFGSGVWTRHPNIPIIEHAANGETLAYTAPVYDRGMQPVYGFQNSKGVMISTHAITFWRAS
jgi:hypothetical protein